VRDAVTLDEMNAMLYAWRKALLDVRDSLEGEAAAVVGVTTDACSYAGRDAAYIARAGEVTKRHLAAMNSDLRRASSEIGVLLLRNKAVAEMIEEADARRRTVRSRMGAS
jgi:hypothetical protein